MALVRVARLEDLQSLDSLIERLTAIEAGGPPIRHADAPPAKKRGGRAEAASTPTPVRAAPAEAGDGRARSKSVPRATGAPWPAKEARPTTGQDEDGRPRGR